MLPLFFGLLAVLILFGLILADMERKRRRLSELLERLEPLVERGQRLHVRNLRGLNNNLLYAYNLLENVEHVVRELEQQKGLAPPAGGRRFSLNPGRRLRDLEERIGALEQQAQGTAGAPVLPTPPEAPPPPAPEGGPTT